MDRLEGKAAVQRDLCRLQEQPLRSLWRVSPGKCSSLQGPGQVGVATEGLAALQGRCPGGPGGQQNEQVSSAPLRQRGLNTHLAAQATR